MNEQFIRVAEAVTKRMLELLHTKVVVLDDRGVAIASSEPSFVGSLFDLPEVELGPDYLQIPVRLDGQIGEVLVAQPANGEVLSPLLTQALIELMIDQALVVTRLPNQHELKNKFIHDLLRGSTSDEADILREGQILGMDFTRPRAVLLIDASDYILASAAGKRFEVAETQVWRRAQLVIGSIVSFFHLPNDTICAYIGNGEVAVLKASSTQDLAAWTDQEERESQANPSWANLSALKRAGVALLMRLRCDTNASISIGIGRHHPGIQGLARSYQDARAALSLGRRFHGQNQVHCLDQLGIAAFVGVADETTKIDLAKHLLSPLDHEAELLETLDVFFFENCGPSQTANRLSIHRNTLSYRLDKIASLTGLDPRRFDDAMQIRLALLLKSLQGDPAGLCRCPTIGHHNHKYPGQMSDASLSSVIQYR